jgi:DNA-binding NtrC family response regulator
MITAYASIPSAVETMKKGAYDYIAKPFNLEDVRKAVRSALEKVALKKENTQLRAQIEQFEGKVKIVTQNSMMQKLLETARQIAPTDCNVLITGESGTGKELFARYLHFMSHRSDAPFFAVNCGALTEELLTNELFGHEKGAFTGASTMKKGLIEAAAGGTLFLDEITEMSPAMQVKLLRFLQEKELTRVGGTTPIHVDVRILAASNRNIHEVVLEKKFRKDLYYRLNVVSLHIPPLSERRDDIPLLCQYFLKKYAVLMSKDVREIAPDVVSLLVNYDFPGNVRELENIIERGVALAKGHVIETAHLPDDLKDLDIKTFRRKEGRFPSLEDQEISYIKWVLQETGGNKSVAANILGIDRVSLWRKIKKYGMEEDPGAGA